MRSQARTKTFNTIFILLGISLMIYSYPKAFHRQSSELSAIDAIGAIASVKNDARIKKSHLFNWNAGNKGSPLAPGDLVFTNRNSEADLLLNEGHKISLSSQTLLKIKGQELEVRNGAVEIALGQNEKALKIKLGDDHYVLSGKGDKGAKVSISSQAGKSKFLVSEGNINIKGKNIDVDAKGGDEVVASAQSVRKSDVNITLVYPNNESILLAAGEKLQFKASGAPKGSFANISTSSGEMTAPLDTDIALAPGQYTWALANEEGALSPQAFFDLKVISPAPKLIAPENLSTHYFYGDQTSIDLKWKAEEKVRLQVYEATGRLALSKGGLEKSHETKLIKEGTYSWQARVETPSHESQWSSPSAFVVIKQDYTKGDPIVIELERPDQLAKFDWKNSGPGDRFVLSKRADFSTTLREEVVGKKNSFETVIPEVGIYYWKLVKESGEASSALPKRVLIRPTPPPSKPKTPPALRLKLKNRSSSFWRKLINLISPISIAHASEYEEAVISFDEIDRAKIYEVEIYQDKRLKTLVYKTQTNSPSFSWSPKRGGRYYWRLRFQDHWERWSPFSDASALSVTLEKKRKRIAKRKKPRPRKAAPPKKLVARVKKTAPKSQRDWKASALYLPSSISFQQENIEINGEALGGHSGELNYKNYGLIYRSQYGDVFDGQNYFQRQLNIFALYDLMGIKLGPSLMAGMNSSYELSSDESSVVEGENQNFFLPGIRAEKSFKISEDSAFKLGASGHFLSGSFIEAFTQLDYALSEKFGIEGILRWSSLALETEDDETIEQSSLSLGLGPYYRF